MRTSKACAGVFVGAIAAAAFAGDPDPREILKKTDEATKATKGVYYEAEWYVAEGEGADQAPKISGQVWLARTPEGSMPKLAAKGEMKRGSEARAFNIATDSKAIASIDDKAKTITRGALPASMELIGQGPQRLYFIEYNHPTPFEQEVESESAKYEGEKKVGDVDCHVIYVVYGGDAPESRWYVGKEDYLPRRVDRINMGADDKKTVAVLQINKLDTKPELKDEIFAPATPAGYEEKKHTPAASPGRPELLSAGTEAPEWELQTPAGDKVSLKSLRGKVVVLDFWATWCGPCKKAMPTVQKIHEHFKGKPVQVIGLSCWERGGDPAAYMKEKSYTYMLLLNADDVAEKYQVSGIPTFYVIGTDGKIVFSDSGMPSDDSELITTITKALPRENE